MTKIKVRGRDLSLRFILTVGVLLVVGVAALAYFVRTGMSIRRHDPKAVLPAPPGVRPERLPLKTPMTPEKPQEKIVKHPKLSTPLAHLARAVPQQRGAVPKGQRITPPAGFSVEALPKSVRDAVRVRRMRINKDAGVQVYIVMAEITEENLEQLQSAGVTVELRDEQQRIVQARVPVTRLEEVAALLFVRSVRLPDYGIPNTGSVTTEGDTILT